MSRTPLLVAAALVAVGALAWDLLRAGPASAPAETVAVAKVPVQSPAVTSMSPGGPAGVRMAANFLRPAAVTTVGASPLAREFGSAVSFKPLYDRLRGSAEGETPEGRFYLYRILRACATVSDRKAGRPARTQTAAQLEERRQRIAASLPEGDPRRAQRLQALDKVATDPCAGLPGLTVTEAELEQLLQGALAGGDPKARAWTVEQEMNQERRSGNAPWRAGATLSDAQISSLQEAFSSRDPEAIAISGRVLANAFRDLTVRIGPDLEPIENRAFMNAALLLACEYGYDCGENHARVLAACAFQGHCGVASLPDYLFYYGATPHDAQVLDRYRSVLRQAADTGDWSGLVIERGERSPNAPSVMMHSPYFGR